MWFADFKYSGEGAESRPLQSTSVYKYFDTCEQSIVPEITADFPANSETARTTGLACQGVKISAKNFPIQQIWSLKFLRLRPQGLTDSTGDVGHYEFPR